MQRRVRSVNKLQQIFWKAAESHCFTYARKSNRQQIHVSTTQRGSLPRSAVHPLHHATKWQFITNVIEASKNDLLPNDPLTDPRRSYTVCLQRINHKGTVGAVFVLSFPLWWISLPFTAPRHEADRKMTEFFRSPDRKERAFFNVSSWCGGACRHCRCCWYQSWKIAKHARNLTNHATPLHKGWSTHKDNGQRGKLVLVPLWRS